MHVFQYYEQFLTFSVIHTTTVAEIFRAFQFLMHACAVIEKTSCLINDFVMKFFSCLPIFTFFFYDERLSMHVGFVSHFARLCKEKLPP